MDFDEIYKSIVLTEEAVLDLVDEYTLYCYYTGIDNIIPGKAYQAPYYRKDNYPSFSIYECRSPRIEYMWKDHATGEAGSIFKLIRMIEGLNNSNEVLARINEDFDLGYNTTNPVRKEKIVWYEKPVENNIKIKVVDCNLTKVAREYWSTLKVDQALLSFFNTGQVKFYWTYEGQATPQLAPDPMFYYRVGEYYQLYAPYIDKKYKFRNDLPENYFLGYMQLPKTGQKLVIDKSMKDVIFCHRLGFPAVSGKSETTMIPHNKMLELKERFDEVYLTLDPDAAGRKQVEKYMSLYPWLKPRFLEEAKDKSDLCFKYGFEHAQETINKLLT